MKPTPVPKLAPPGAGLPAIENMVARVLFGLRCRMGNRKSFTSKFQLERQRIAALIRSCDAETGAQQVLIRRPPGLEDSSRNWSIWMVLDHLRIVHHELIRVISTLAEGRTPDGKASTAAVKPGTSADARIVAAYESSCDSLLSTVEAVLDLNTTIRFAHPWFGPLNAAGWHALAGSHMGIHRVQIERIFAGLLSRQEN